MLDEDVVLKSARYANERVLILNTLALVLLPAIFDGGSSVVGFCLIFSIGLIAPVNMLTYPANWIDAPEYSRLKYFAALLPYIAFLALSCFRLEIPAVEYSPEYGGFFFLNGSQNPLAAAFIDGFAAMTDPIVLLVAAACAVSAYFVTQSRFVLRNTMILCGASVAVLTLAGWILKAVAGINAPAQTGLMASEAFSTFSDGRAWSPFALMWAAALFAVGIYTVQRFRPLSMLLSKRTAVLGMGALVFAGAAYSASPFFLPVCWLVMAFIAAVYMFNVLPSEARMAIHRKMAGEAHKKLPISKKIFPFMFYAAAFAASCAACAASYFKYADFREGAAGTPYAAQEAAMREDCQKLIEEKPLFGWGPDSFATVSALTQGDDLEFAPRPAAETSLEETLLENGKVLTAALAVVPALFFIRMVLRMRISQSGLILMASLAACAFLGIFENPFNSPSVIISFWVLMFCMFSWENAEII